MFTTLNRIKDCNPCEEGWRKLLNSLNKTQSDDAPLSIRHIIESNGVEDAIWALRAVDGHDREMRLFAAWCAEQVLPIFEKAYPRDNRPRVAIKAARDYANGWIHIAAMAAAGAESWNAAGAAARAAESAAAVPATTNAAARAAAMAAEWAVVGAPIWAAAMTAQKIELIRVCECIEQGVDPYPINFDSQP